MTFTTNVFLQHLVSNILKRKKKLLHCEVYIQRNGQKKREKSKTIKKQKHNKKSHDIYNIQEETSFYYEK